MGSSEVEAKNDVRRLHAREFVTGVLSKSCNNSPAVVGKTPREDGHSFKTNLALSGRATTSKGYVIVHPSETRVTALKYEELPSDVKFSIGEGNESNLGKQLTYQSNFVTKFGKASNTQTHNGIGKMNIKVKVDPKTEHSSRHFHGKDDDRSSVNDTSNDLPKRSTANVAPIGNVTGSSNPASQQIAALYEKRIGSERRRRPIVQQTGNSQKSRDNPPEKSSHHTSGNSRKSEPSKHTSSVTTQRKTSNYLPTYIHPVVEEPSYRTPYLMSRNATSKDPPRKQSVNRFESSPSSSSISSSSESDDNSPDRKISHEVLPKSPPLRIRHVTTETPDTSDAEKTRPEGRRRRARRQRPGNDIKQHPVAQLGKVTVIERTGTAGIRSRGEDGVFRRRYRRENNDPVLEGKYVTLPDNYTHSEFSTKNTSYLASKNNPNHQPQLRNDNKTALKEKRLNQVHLSPADNSPDAGGRYEAISQIATSSYSDKQNISSVSNEEKLIISSGKESSSFVKTGNRSYGQTSSPADKSRRGDQLTTASGISKHVDISDNSLKLDKAGQNSSTPISGRPTELQSSLVFKTRRNSSEARALGNIRSIFENHEAPKREFGQSFPKKEANSQESNASLTKSNIQDSSYNDAVQSQPMINARKIGEDFWPRDEATEKLLSSRKTSSVSSTVSDTKSEDENLTMQDTIDQLHKLACDDTPVIRSKSRSNSTVGLVDTSRSDFEAKSASENNELSRTSESVTDNAKPAPYVRKSSNTRPNISNLSKVQMVKISPLDRSPCMSSTETLKESSSGEYQGRNSRSHSFESIASNPETILHNSNSNLKDRNLHPSRKTVFEQPEQNSELVIVEGVEASDTQLEEKNYSLRSKSKTSTDDQDQNSGSKSLVTQLNELTESLKKVKLIGPPQSINTAKANWQKATTKTDHILSVSPRGNVTRHPPNLEPLCEDPEPPSPKMKHKEQKQINSIFEMTNSRKKDSKVKQSRMHKKEESLDIDEGIVTEEEVNEDPHSYLKLEERLDESNRRRNRTSNSTLKDSDGSNSNESNRSLSDPMSNRKRSVTGEKSIDSNLLGSLQNGKATPISAIGSFEQQSASSLSVFSEHISLYGDSPVNEETPDLDELDVKSQSKPSKKKSFSDPNPKGQFRYGIHANAEAIQETELMGVQSASSEPNVTEQTDQLGDLDQFKIYANKAKANKAMDQVDSNFKSQRNVRRNVSMKSRIRAENVAMNNASNSQDGNSIIGQLLASNNHQNMKKNKILEADSPTSIASTTSESSPVQNPAQTHDMFENVEQQFNKMYDSMTSSKENEILNKKDKSRTSVHSRSSSEPVDMRTSVIEDLDTFDDIDLPVFNRGRRAGIAQAPSMDNMGSHYAENARSKSEVDTSPTFSPAHHTQSMDMVYSPKKKEKTKGKKVHDMRLHVVKNLLETEESYVGSLQILYEDYMKPLKHPDFHSICEPRLVDEMFHKIPQLFQHHAKFYEDVQECYHSWNTRDVQLGELFLNSFNKDALLETYTSYIKNYLNAREAVRTAMQAKNSFKTFIEQCQRENKDKQGLSDLMIKPVQRIPRYELIIKDLLKHTPETHQDRAGLLIAQREIKTLAEQMNRSEKEAEAADKHARLLQDIEQIIEGCIDLCLPKRRFLKQDLVSELKSGSKKDRGLWLFNDLIICTTAKKGRAPSSLRRSSMNLWSASQDRFSLDNKYKFLWKFPLEDVEHLKGNTGPARSMTIERQIQGLQTDSEILNSIQKLTLELTCNHLQLDESLKQLINHVNRQINEKNLTTSQSYLPPGRFEMGISTGDGVKTFLFEFPTEDNKLQFERLFASAKRSLSTQKNRWEPTFMKAIPISKTRAGMQFSCAAPNVDQSPDVREVWVCNTDGYVGQVCFLSLESEPTQTQCITVCHAKICCIAQVPTSERKLVRASTLLQGFSKGPLAQPSAPRRHSSSASNPVHTIMAWDEYSDEDNTSPVSTHSTNSFNSVSPYSTNNSTSNYDMLPNADLGALPGAAWKKDSDGSTLHGSLEDLLGDGGGGTVSGDSMWLGTEDGKINIYPSSEGIRGNKNCVKLPHSAAVQCILYHEGQVFVALSNGDLVIYARNNITGEWNFENHKTKSKVSSPHAITKMVIVGQELKQLWCGCQNQIKIIDVHEHNEVDHFMVTQDTKRQIYCIVCHEYGVWVALDKRPQIKLFHSVSHDLLAEIDVSSPVSKMLASADAIIRQHKAACLRITALLVCKDLLWVGTSAGVVLTLSLPKIGTHTSSLPLPVMPQGLAYGHTGHVRFLTSVDITDKENSLSRGGSHHGNTKRRTSVTNGPNNQSHATLIISGGDGYEDFRMNSTSESAGREDSTNHLLVWRA